MVVGGGVTAVGWTAIAGLTTIAATHVKRGQGIIPWIVATSTTSTTVAAIVVVRCQKRSLLRLLLGGK